MLDILGQIAFWLSLGVVFILVMIAVFLVVYLVALLPASIFLGKYYEKVGIAPEFWTVVLSFVIAGLATYNAAVARSVSDRVTGRGTQFQQNAVYLSRDGCAPLYWHDPISLLKPPFIS